MTLLDIAPWPPEPTKRGLLDLISPTVWLLIAAATALAACIALAVAYRRRVARQTARTLCTLIAALLVGSASVMAQNDATSTRKGDVNGDGTVDVADIVAVIDLIQAEQEAPAYVYLLTTTNDFTVLCSYSEVFTKSVEYVDAILSSEVFAAYPNITAANFDFNYILDMNGTEVKQYADTEGFQAIERMPYFGTVKDVYDAHDATNNVLRWTVYNDEAYAVFKDGKKTPQVIYVRFTKIGSIAGPDYVFAKLEWAPANTNVTPSASISDSDKIFNYWYKNYSNESGYEAIRSNVQMPGMTGATCSFSTDILSTFVGNTIKFHDLDAVYTPAGNPNALTIYPELVFATPDPVEVKGNDGKTYVLEVNDYDKTLKAYRKDDATQAKQVIAKIAQVGTAWNVYYGSESGNPAAASTYAKAILNYAGHQNLAKGQTFTAKMAVNGYTCYPVCTIPVDNGEFYVKFLRPITVVDRTADQFIDAQTGGSDVKVNLNIIDWRSIKFADTDHATLRGGQNYFTYYGVQSINIDTNPNNVLTNMHQADASIFRRLADVTANLYITYTAPTLAELTATPTATNQLRYGTLHYQNNGANAGDFDLKFPGTLTYAWGTVNFEVTVHVDYSIAN